MINYHGNFRFEPVCTLIGPVPPDAKTLGNLGDDTPTATSSRPGFGLAADGALDRSNVLPS